MTRMSKTIKIQGFVVAVQEGYYGDYLFMRHKKDKNLEAHEALLLISEGSSHPRAWTEEELCDRIKEAWVLGVTGKTKPEVQAFFQERYSITL